MVFEGRGRGIRVSDGYGEEKERRAYGGGRAFGSYEKVLKC